MILEIQGLHKTFNAGTIAKRHALDGVDLGIQENDFLVIVGANGSGKSTLLNSLAGSILPDAGKIWLKGRDISLLPAYKRSPWIARVFQDPLAGTAPALSVLDNFRLAALRHRKKTFRLGNSPAFRAEVSQHIASLNMGLEHLLESPMGELSGGQRQALTLLMCTMAPLEILLLDEPTAALDPRSARMIMEVTAKLVEQYKLTAILITHNMQEALQYGNRLVQMQNGKIHRAYNQQEKAKLQLETLLAWFHYDI